MLNITFCNNAKHWLEYYVSGCQDKRVQKQVFSEPAIPGNKFHRESSSRYPPDKYGTNTKILNSTVSNNAQVTTILRINSKINRFPGFKHCWMSTFS